MSKAEKKENKKIVGMTLLAAVLLLAGLTNLGLLVVGITLLAL